MSNCKWILKRPYKEIDKASKTLGLSKAVTQLLINRGITSIYAANKYLNPSYDDLYSPYLMKNMELAVTKIVKDIADNKKIAIYGDYDVDGVMSVVILYRALRSFNADVMYYIPHRQNEGYGLNTEAVCELNNIGVNTILTCDNGISAINEIDTANKLGIDVIVLDHHEPGFIITDEIKTDVLPNAFAIVDPKQQYCEYPFKELCAASICYKFVQALHMVYNVPAPEQYLVYAAIATICDIVALTDENRGIASLGIELINKVSIPALQSLADINNLKSITSYHIGFIIGPCINATGRLETAKMAIDLFLSDDYDEAMRISAKLLELNNERKNLTSKAVTEITTALENSGTKDDKIIVAYNTNIHESVAGIVAGRIREAYYKPVIVITGALDFCKGSGRSIEAYNMFEALSGCGELFEKFGGHSMAAGFTIKEENIEKLRLHLNSNCPLSESDFIPTIYIDAHLKIEEVTFELYEQIQFLKPFGKSNTKPLFADKNVNVIKIDYIGAKKDTVKFHCKTKNGSTIYALFFFGYEKFKSVVYAKFQNSDDAQAICSGGKTDLFFDFVYETEINEYNGNKSLQLIIKDIRFSNL